MNPINPKITKMLKESNKHLNGVTVTGENCVSVLQTMALQHLANKISNDHHKKHKRSKDSKRLLSA